MTNEELREIIDTNKWITIKDHHRPYRYTGTDWEFEFSLLSAHHRDKTNFLVDKCRDLAIELHNIQKNG